MAESGTDTRRRKAMLAARFNEQEAEAVRQLADRAGLSVASLIRHAVLNVPAPRAARRPTADGQAVGRLLGELGRVRTALDGLAEGGQADPCMVEDALATLAEMRIVCFQALGREP